MKANQQNEETKLERVLREAAMVNKTVIITTVNSAWMMPNSIFDLFLESFRVGNQTQVLLNHLIVVAFDQEAQNRCLELHSHCYALRTEGVDFSSKVDFMSAEYLKMMWSRIGFLHTVLKKGYSFIFTVISFTLIHIGLILQNHVKPSPYFTSYNNLWFI